jgi:hypothetical protein
VYDRLTRRRDVIAPEIRAAARFVDAWIAYWGESEARAAWIRLGSQLSGTGVSRPEPWWIWEEGIPTALRGKPTTPADRDALFSARTCNVSYIPGKPGLVEELKALVEDAAALERARLEWITSSEKFSPAAQLEARRRLTMLPAPKTETPKVQPSS